MNTNAKCQFTTPNGYYCTMDAHDDMPNRHYMRKEMLIVIDPTATEDTDEWTGAFWYAASTAILLTIAIGVCMAAFALYFMGAFNE